MHLNNGYECVYLPGHPNARPNGYVYKHRLVMEEELGRRLAREEHVHHKDGNKRNNDIENLELISNKIHAHMHKGFKKKRPCSVCGKETYNELFCSQECNKISQRKVVRPSKDVLIKKIWSKPISQLAIELGVSDTCIRKWCKKYEISDLPPRGYWQKKNAGKL
jgi:predicted nucleic acid-binding Zn ribbon protein